jgi:hypothetical protein
MVTPNTTQTPSTAKYRNKINRDTRTMISPRMGGWLDGDSGKEGLLRIAVHQAPCFKNTQPL